MLNQSIHIEVSNPIQSTVDTSARASMHTHTHHTGMTMTSYDHRVSGEVRDTL